MRLGLVTDLHNHVAELAAALRVQLKLIAAPPLGQCRCGRRHASEPFVVTST
jgi:hypothetical protein